MGIEDSIRKKYRLEKYWINQVNKVNATKQMTILQSGLWYQLEGQTSNFGTIIEYD